MKIGGPINSSAGKVVPFDQNSSFFHRRAMKNIDKEKLDVAISYVRKALDKEPDNSQYKLDMASIYSEMERFELSNRVLFLLLRQDESCAGECYFGLGCNYLAMQQFERAQGLLQKYLSVEPEGEYADDAQDILEFLWAFVGRDRESMRQWRLHHRLLRAQESVRQGQLDEALKRLKPVAAYAPFSVQALNVASAVYFEQKDTASAIKTAEQVISAAPDDITALCNLAAFYHADGRAGDAKNIAEQLARMKYEKDIPDADDFEKICVTLCRLGEDALVYDKLKLLLQLKPYDRRAIHFSAIAEYKKERYQKALYLWRRQLLIDPMDSIAMWYADHTRRVLDGREHPRDMGYRMQVPGLEVIRRIRYLNRAAMDIVTDPEGFEVTHQLKSLIVWGLELENRFKNALVVFLGMIGGDFAKETLLSNLWRDDVTDEFKNLIFGMLKTLEVPEPYMAVIGGEVAEVKVSMVPASSGTLPLYREVLETTIETMRANQQYDADALSQVTELWKKYITSQYTDRTLRSPRAMSAALEYQYCRMNDIPVTKAAIMRRYDVSLSSLNRAWSRLLAGITGHSAAESRQEE
ncbi:MAG: tetratricopeptide repeat protein [Christensenellales bacterium]|jgi:tetratricopeptide (TPR) repeat protein